MSFREGIRSGHAQNHWHYSHFFLLSLFSSHSQWLPGAHGKTRSISVSGAEDSVLQKRNSVWMLVEDIGNMKAGDKVGYRVWFCFCLVDLYAVLKIKFLILIKILLKGKNACFHNKYIELGRY